VAAIDGLIHEVMFMVSHGAVYAPSSDEQFLHCGMLPPSLIFLKKPS
jgi:hypothetical protein